MKIVGATLQYLIAWATAFPGFVFPGRIHKLQVQTFSGDISLCYNKIHIPKPSFGKIAHVFYFRYFCYNIRL